MDPFLEEECLWSLFHHHLIQILHQIVASPLGDRYRARVSQRNYVTEQALFTSVLRQEHHEDYIEIRQRNDGRLITLLEIVSPANKTTPQGRSAFLEKSRECRIARANLVEIDLVLQGQPMIDYSRDGLPDWNYAVSVSRSPQPNRYEIYTTTLQKRLPPFKLPLAPDDHDVIVDLHKAFTRCYEDGGFSTRIDYSRDPHTTLSDDNRRWLDDLLKRLRLR
jgi:hypothetical protein